MMTAEEHDKLYDSFQDEIKQYLPSDAELREMTPDQLHDLLRNLRRDLIVPPWHPVTDYIKEYAKAQVAGRVTPDKSWYYTFSFSRPLTEIVPIGERTWVDVHVHLKKDGAEGVVDFAVQGFDKLWYYLTEGLSISQSDHVQLRIYKADGTTVAYSMPTAQLFAAAAEIQNEDGKFEGDIYIDRDNLPQPLKKARRVRMRKAEDEAVQEPAKTSKPPIPYEELVKETMLSEADKDTLETVFVIACHQYPELSEKWHALLARIRAVL